MNRENQKILTKKFPKLYSLMFRDTKYNHFVTFVSLQVGKLLPKKAQRWLLTKTYKTLYASSMFGIECGNGWFNVIYKLSEKIEAYNKKASNKNQYIVATQIKEKYGTLRYYVNHATDEIYDLISEAEHESSTVCEQCGEPGTEIEDYGWFSTSCQKCLRENQK